MERLLGQFVDIDVGFPFSSVNFTTEPSGIRLLRGDNVGHGRVRWDGAQRWPAESFPASMILVPGDIVVAMDRPWIGSGLKWAYLRPEDVPSLLVQRVARLRARSPLLQGYLRCIVGSRRFTQYILGVQTGTTVPHISASQIAAFRIGPLPPESVQRDIATTIGAIEAKIDSNFRLVALAERYLTSFLDGEPSEGWNERALSELARFINGGAYTSDAAGTGRIVIRIAELTRGPGGSTVKSSREVPQDHVANPGDVLMSWSGSIGVYRWFRDEAIINQHIFKVVSETYPAWFVFDRLRRAVPAFARIAADKATTMGHIKREHLDEALALVPSTVQLKTLDRQLGPVWNRLLLAERESHILASVRDTLLPELLSGRLRVREAEELVESVT